MDSLIQEVEGVEAVVGTTCRHAFSQAERMRDSDGGVIYISTIIPCPVRARYLHLLLAVYTQYRPHFSSHATDSDHAKLPSLHIDMVGGEGFELHSMWN